MTFFFQIHVTVLTFQVWRGILTLYSLLSLTLICFSQRRAVGRGGLLQSFVFQQSTGTKTCYLPSKACVPVSFLYVSVGLRDCSPGETWQWGTKSWDASDDSVKARDTCISVCWNAHDRWPDDLVFLSWGFCDRQRLRMKAGWICWASVNRLSLLKLTD